jgi:hypothetical protein
MINKGFFIAAGANFGCIAVVCPWIFPAYSKWYNATMMGRNAIDEKKLVYQAGIKCTF